MDLGCESATYRLRAWGPNSRNVVALAPFVVAGGWLLADVWHGQLSTWTLVFSGVMGALGAVGLCFVFTPVKLVADTEGLRWSQFAYRRSIAWSTIENIGVAVSKSFEGWDNPAVEVLTRSRPPAEGPKIGVNLKLEGRNSSTVSYKRGFTGYDVNWTNVFKPSAGEIVAELQARLERYRKGSVH